MHLAPQVKRGESRKFDMNDSRIERARGHERRAADRSGRLGQPKQYPVGAPIRRERDSARIAGDLAATLPFQHYVVNQPKWRNSTR